MVIAPLLAPIFGFLLREVVVKFIVFTALFAVVAFLVPMAVAFVAPYLGVSSLNSAFLGLSGGVWFFLDFFNLAFGVPLLITAWITRFLVRRLPVIG